MFVIMDFQKTFTYITKQKQNNCCNNLMVGSEFGVNNMKVWINHNAAGDVMMWARFTWDTLGPLVPTELHLNVTAYLSVAELNWNLFNETNREFTALKWPPVTRSTKLTFGMWLEWKSQIMEVQLTDLNQLHNAVMSIWSKILEELNLRHK